VNVSSRNNILQKNWFKLMINDNYIFHLKSMMIKKILIKTILKIFYSFYWIINICIGDVYWCCQLRDSSNIVGSLSRRHSISICIFRLLYYQFHVHYNDIWRQNKECKLCLRVVCNNLPSQGQISRGNWHQNILIFFD